LAQIERGETASESFRRAIEIYAEQITAELLDTKIEFSDNNSGKCPENTPICPKCKTANVRFFPKVAKCTDQNCGLVVFRNMSEKQLSDKQITDLLTTGKTAVIKSFKSKSGKPFDAGLKFDENFKVVFDFPERKGKK